MRRPLAIVVVALSALLISPARPGSAEENESLATYNGRVIDLSRSWEGAQACLISETGNRCFDTEGEMRAATAVDADDAARVPAVCSDVLSLYDGTGFATPVVALNTRLTTLTLSTYGFANATSSYRIGPCSAAFYNGGSTYPGATSAGASASSMVTGWSNTLDSVYIF